MDTRAVKNPYPDYDGSPASTQAFFDYQGKVMYGLYVCVSFVSAFECPHCLTLSSRSAHVGVCAAAELQNQRASGCDGKWAEVCRSERLHHVHRLGR